MEEPKDKNSSSSSASPFVFLQPKLELDTFEAPLPPLPSHKPKFEPKLKPRPQPKARPPKPPAHLQPKHHDSGDGKPTPPLQPVKHEEVPNMEAQLPVKMDMDMECKASIAESVKAEEEGINAVKLDLDSGVQEEVIPIGDLEIEDEVVREIDVFYCPVADGDTQMYLLQYLLRPYWRPYGLEESCLEVRLKPKQSKLEVDLAVDTYGENYDQDAGDHLKIKKQILSSSRTSLTTSYAVGILRGNKLFVNPLHAVAQLRPSMKHLDAFDSQKKQRANRVVGGDDEEMVGADDEGEDKEPEEKEQLVAVKVEVKKQETARQEQIRLQSYAYLKQLEEAEAWIPLEPHGTDSPVTDAIRRMLVEISDYEVPFTMFRSEYMKTLVPDWVSPGAFEATKNDMHESDCLSRSFLDSLPMEQRFEKLLSKGRVHILQFERLMKLAPAGCTEQEVLAVLQDYAYLVQGCWVAASSLRYSGPICIVRDYILSLFTKNRVLHHEQLQQLQVPREMIREALLPLAVQKPAEGGWEFQESTDRSFMKRHQAVQKEQSQKWIENEDKIKAAALALRIGNIENSVPNPLNQNKESKIPYRSINVEPQLSVGLTGSKKAQGNSSAAKKDSETGGFTGEWTMSEDTRAALPGSLREIFLKHHVCSLQFLRLGLRELAITKAAAPSTNPKAIVAAVAAAKGADAPLPEFTAAVSHVASNIDGIYFLTTLGNPSLDPFRDVVIALLRARGPNAGLRKVDIVEASKIALKTEVPAQVYQKVMKELCYTKASAWLLKPGDGRPS